MNMDEPTLFFSSPDAFYQWLEQHHQHEAVIWVGYYKKHTGIPSLTWPESVDQALCFGWIDGLRRSVDADRYKIRFTPRKPTSIWSDVNVRRYAELLQENRIQPAGIAAYARKKNTHSGLYSFEQNPEQIVLPEEFERQFKSRKTAWSFFQQSAPSIRKASIWWVVSAKQETTRLRRLTELIRCCEEGKKLKHLQRPGESA